MNILTTTEFDKFTTMEREIDNHNAVSIDLIEYTLLRRRFKGMTEGCPTRIFLALHSLIEDGRDGIEVRARYRALTRSTIWTQWVKATVPPPFTISAPQQMKAEVHWENYYY